MLGFSFWLENFGVILVNSFLFCKHIYIYIIKINIKKKIKIFNIKQYFTKNNILTFIKYIFYHTLLLFFLLHFKYTCNIFDWNTIIQDVFNYIYYVLCWTFNLVLRNFFIICLLWIKFYIKFLFTYSLLRIFKIFIKKLRKHFRPGFVKHKSYISTCEKRRIPYFCKLGTRSYGTAYGSNIISKRKTYVLKR